jgi:hypothetical protein
MAAMLAATSGGIAGIRGHAPNAGPQPGARQGPPGLPLGVAPSQPRYPGNEAGRSRPYRSGRPGWGAYRWSSRLRAS